MQTYRDSNSMPPRHVYSGTVENATDVPIVVQAVYQTPPDGHHEHVDLHLAPHEKGHIDQKLVVMGSMTATGHIEQVHVSVGDAVVASVHAPLGVWSPTKDFPFVVQKGSDGHFHIDQPARHPNA